MCGIVGICANSSIGERDWILQGRDLMTHRGPDGAGEWRSADGRVAFAHRRLAIIDLSPAGQQPMTDATGDLTIVFNGEIYNFAELREELHKGGAVFRSHSDTEVLLQAYRFWGPECLARLNGMFALAIHDARQHKLFLARDRAGEKPLFYRVDGRELRFASELKGLLADPSLSRRIDTTALDCYLAMGYVPGELCMLSGTKKLPPAHAMIFDIPTGAHKVWRYWQPPTHDEAAGIDEASILDELEFLLEDSVRKQLVADVPVGVLLSGGVDSSLITAMAARVTKRVKTFTIRFPGHKSLDETEHARLIARHFGTDHIELDAQSASASLLPRLAHQFDEPMADSSMVPTYLVSSLIRQHCTVALGGDGGDELFGGYGHHSRLLWLQRRLGWIPLGLRRMISSSAGVLLPVGMKGRNWLQGLGVDLERGLPLIASHFDSEYRRRLVPNILGFGTQAEVIFKQRIPSEIDLLQRTTRMDFQNYLAEDILVKVDRASMMNSLEVRAPFLDVRMIEFAFGKVPARLKATSNGKKILLKRLTERVLPPEFDRQRKQGFSIPLSAWLRAGPFRQLFYDVLLDKDCFFDSRATLQLLRGLDKGRSNSERLFGLVMFELWRREYGVSL
jgi:asparagine synthase (glutamine-hydrolysing)